MRQKREDYSDTLGKERVQSLNCNCPGARCMVRRIVKDAHNVVLRIDELIMVWNFRRCLLLYIFELIIEEPV